MAQADFDSLVAIARDASRSEEERTTATHALKRFPAEQAIPVLIDLMKDDALSVRWAAAATLRSFGQEMLPPLLQALATRPEDHNFYESAHHALTRFGNPDIEKILAPVLDALTHSGASATVPAIAMEALQQLQPE